MKSAAAMYGRSMLKPGLCFSIFLACCSSRPPQRQMPVANAASCPRASPLGLLNVCGARIDLPFNGAVIVAGPSSGMNGFAFRDKEQRVDVAEKELAPGLHALQPYTRGDVELLHRSNDGSGGWRVIAEVHFAVTTPPPRIAGPAVRSVKSCGGRVVANLEGVPHERVTAVVLDRVMPGVGIVASIWTYPSEVPSVEFATSAFKAGDSASLAWIDVAGRFSERSGQVVVEPCE